MNIAQKRKELNAEYEALHTIDTSTQHGAATYALRHHAVNSKLAALRNYQDITKKVKKLADSKYPAELTRLTKKLQSLTQHLI
jgi:hypothetical protein